MDVANPGTPIVFIYLFIANQRHNLAESHNGVMPALDSYISLGIESRLILLLFGNSDLIPMEMIWTLAVFIFRSLPWAGFAATPDARNNASGAFSHSTHQWKVMASIKAKPLVLPAKTDL